MIYLECLECGREFQVSRKQTGRQKYCSPLCRQRYWQKTHREEMREYNRKRREKQRGLHPKFCLICGRILPKGKSRYCSEKCFKKGHKISCERAKKKRRELINKIKLQRGCQRCGYNKCARALDFHHKNRKTKKFEISGGRRRYSLERVKKEIAKCIVLCKNCHYELMEDRAIERNGDVE